MLVFIGLWIKIEITQPQGLSVDGGSEGLLEEDIIIDGGNETIHPEGTDILDGGGIAASGVGIEEYDPTLLYFFNVGQIENLETPPSVSEMFIGSKTPFSVAYLPSRLFNNSTLKLHKSSFRTIEQDKEQFFVDTNNNGSNSFFLNDSNQLSIMTQQGLYSEKLNTYHIVDIDTPYEFININEPINTLSSATIAQYQDKRIIQSVFSSVITPGIYFIVFNVYDGNVWKSGVTKLDLENISYQNTVPGYENHTRELFGNATTHILSETEYVEDIFKNKELFTFTLSDSVKNSRIYTCWEMDITVGNIAYSHNDVPAIFKTQVCNNIEIPGTVYKNIVLPSLVPINTMSSLNMIDTSSSLLSSIDMENKELIINGPCSVITSIKPKSSHTKSITYDSSNKTACSKLNILEASSDTINTSLVNNIADNSFIGFIKINTGNINIDIFSVGNPNGGTRFVITDINGEQTIDSSNNISPITTLTNNTVGIEITESIVLGDVISHIKIIINGQSILNDSYINTEEKTITTINQNNTMDYYINDLQEVKAISTQLCKNYHNLINSTTNTTWVSSSISSDVSNQQFTNRVDITIDGLDPTELGCCIPLIISNFASTSSQSSLEKSIITISDINHAKPNIIIMDENGNTIPHEVFQQTSIGTSVYINVPKFSEQTKLIMLYNNLPATQTPHIKSIYKLDETLNSNAVEEVRIFDTVENIVVVKNKGQYHIIEMDNHLTLNNSLPSSTNNVNIIYKTEQPDEVTDFISVVLDEFSVAGTTINKIGYAK